MKKALSLFILALAALFVFANGQSASDPIPVSVQMKLRWDPANAWEDLSGFKVYLSQSNTVLRVANVQTNQIELTSILLQEPNGVYQLYVTAVNWAALESDVSDSIWIFWYAQPHRPTNLVVEFFKP